MKAAMFRKDGLGGVIGRLKTPTMLQYEDNGTLRIFNLTGNVIDTEYNDVFVLGQKVDENTLEVQKMESLPKLNEEYLGFRGNGEDGPIYSIVFPANMFRETEELTSEKGITYHKMHFNIDKKNSMCITLFGEYTADTANGCMAFLLKERPTIYNNEYGRGYAVKEWTVRYATGYQLLS